MGFIMRVVCFVCCGLLVGNLMAENTLKEGRWVIDTPGTYEVDTSVREIKVQLTSEQKDEEVCLRFTNAQGYELIAGTKGVDGTYWNNALQVVRGQVVVEIAEKVVVEMGSRLNDADTRYETIKTSSEKNGSLLIRGKGQLIAYVRGTKSTSPAIGSATGVLGTVVIEGNVDVYLAVLSDVSVIQNLASFTLSGGRVYCVPNCSNAEDVSTPVSWTTSQSTSVPIDATKIMLEGGALLGKPTITQASSSTYTGAFTSGFSWTGGSYLSEDSKTYEVGGDTLPGACITFDGTNPCTGTFFADGSGKIYLPNGYQLCYATEGGAEIVTFFGKEATPSEEGMKVEYAFGILRIASARVDGVQKVQLEVGLELPTEVDDTRAIALVVHEHIGEMSTEVYRDNVTFTRVTPDEPLFKATITTSADFKTSYIGTRSYTVTAETSLFSN